MIARLAGTLLEKQADRVILEVGGVGYRVFISFQTFQELPEPGAEATLLIHTHVREDALTLFGFAGPSEQQLFELLIAVTGVGPRLALILLSGIPGEELVRALTEGDVRRLTMIPGVGKKTAERLALELREKARKIFAPPPRPAAGVLPEDVVSALVNFGYRRADADRAVDGLVRAGAPSEFGQFLKQALATLSGA
jgi:Holliday junction DNA helicase RuvA